ncbi:MAG: DNA methyltransferase [Acidobacteriota bacterium]
MNFQAWIAWESLSFPVRMIMPSHYAILCFSKGSPRSLPSLFPSMNDVDAESYIKPLQEFYCVRSSCVASRQRSGSDRTDISDVWYDIHRLKHNSRRVDHPCQLPPLLMRRLFALFTRPHELILDCFNGAGTSTLVAQQMNRGYIGIELSQQYHSIALQRHEQIELGGNPFGKSDIVPIAKNSPVQRLPKQRYEVTKKKLQLDVKRIAHELGHLPNRKEVQANSKFPIEYFDNYFISWGEVCAAARTTGMTELPKDRRPDSDQLELFFDTAKQS